MLGSKNSHYAVQKYLFLSLRARALVYWEIVLGFDPCTPPSDWAPSAAFINLKATEIVRRFTLPARHSKSHDRIFRNNCIFFRDLLLHYSCYQSLKRGDPDYGWVLGHYVPGFG